MRGKRKNKLVAFLLLLLLLVFTACGNGENNEKNGSAEAGSNSPTANENTPGSQQPGDKKGTEPGLFKEDELEIVCFSLGKADSILIRHSGKNVLIDTGEAVDYGTIVNGLARYGVERLDLLLITHFDKDHVGSAAKLLNQFEISAVLYPDYEGSRSEYHQFMTAVGKHDNAGAVTEVTDYDFGDCSFTVYPASRPAELLESNDPDNNMSLICRLVFGERSFVFAGDVEKKRIQQILDDETGLSCDWLKMPHHGKYQKILKDFIELCSPDYAVITDSVNEPADDKTLSFLAEKGIKVYHTIGGDVVTRSDGKTIEVVK